MHLGECSTKDVLGGEPGSLSPARTESRHIQWLSIHQSIIIAKRQPLTRWPPSSLWRRRRWRSGRNWLSVSFFRLYLAPLATSVGYMVRQEVLCESGCRLRRNIPTNLLGCPK